MRDAGMSGLGKRRRGYGDYAGCPEWVESRLVCLAGQGAVVRYAFLQRSLCGLSQSYVTKAATLVKLAAL